MFKKVKVPGSAPSPEIIWRRQLKFALREASNITPWEANR